MTTPVAATGAARTGSYWRTGLLVALAAVAANVVVYVVARSALGADLQVRAQAGSPLMDLPVVAVVVATLVPALLAVAVVGLLRRYGWGLRVFVAAAVLVTALSMLPVLAQPTAAAVRVALATMHVVAAAVVVPGLLAAARRR